jgi:hypothetical protein
MFMAFIKKNHCEDSLVGEYVNNIDEHKQLNNINNK